MRAIPSDRPLTAPLKVQNEKIFRISISNKFWTVESIRKICKQHVKLTADNVAKLIFFLPTRNTGVSKQNRQFTGSANQKSQKQQRKTPQQTFSRKRKFSKICRHINIAHPPSEQKITRLGPEALYLTVLDSFKMLPDR